MSPYLSACKNMRTKRTKRTKSWGDPPSYVPACQFFSDRGRSAPVSPCLVMASARCPVVSVFQVVKTAQSRVRTERPCLRVDFCSPQVPGGALECCG
jgi:hypothetical protein